MQAKSELRDDAVAATDLPLLDRLRDAIISGKYEPGQLMPELALADEFEVSRTPIREALKQLQNEGLVEVRPRVGTFVRIPTRREIVELFQLKESLEGLAAGLMARRGPTPELDILERNVRDAERPADRHDSEGYAGLVHDFHWTLVTGADNVKLSEHYRLLMNQLAYHRIVLRTVARSGRIAASNDEHRAVVEAIRSKDAMGAELAMRHHVHASSQLALATQDFPLTFDPLNADTKTQEPR
ncbi:GntR family transcriptional regulator [Gulosibacter molinativorax]|uniref:GntR family transcriptional regulator n=1 Tax=Gulosibacter molinativorax TaxID=256821 RepID=A0ABT7C6S7_9MICO|nr:GntR family transcriptional regulator [Gulosibacter molinativorax]MDJ1370879.1 GntR family transcriptional regulator [Gulosibacter molinativorax]QUY62216.1 Transcriptional regulator [Gulosibacter molinativorax]